MPALQGFRQRFLYYGAARTGTENGKPCCKNDIVSGPIADDDMTVLFRQYQNSMISMDMLINGMTYKETTSQYSFHTERAVKFLKKVGVSS